jgi:AraC-like DNA-binding protein
MHSAFATDEPGRAEEFLSRTYLDVALSLPRDREGFGLSVERLDAGPFQLDTVGIGARAGFRFEPEGEYYVSTVSHGVLRVVQRGRDEAFVPGEVALLGQPGVESRTEIADFRQGVVTLRTAALREAAGLGPEATEAPALTSARPVSPEHALVWRRAVDFVAGSLAEVPRAAESPLVLGSAERLLAGLAFATFPGAVAAAPARRDLRDARVPAALRRAVTFIEGNAERDIGIGEIAAAARVSRRAVQQAFRRHLDTTPTAYLRRVRLDGAHRELLAAEPGSVSVTEVAYRWGFCSPSRFAERYRAAFGVTPRETLHR